MFVASMKTITDETTGTTAKTDGAQQTKFCYLALVMGYWGRGKTPKEAAMKCKQEGGRSKDFCIVYRIDGDDTAEVNSQGYTIRDPGSENTEHGRGKLSQFLK